MISGDLEFCCCSLVAEFFFFCGVNRNRGIAHSISQFSDFHTILSAIIFPNFPEKKVDFLEW